MRVFAILIAGSLSAAMAIPAAAQTATRSVDDYLCTFAGKCGSDAEATADDSIEAPERKGFKMKRRTAQPAAAQPTVAVPRVAAAVPPASNISRTRNLAGPPRVRAPKRLASNTKGSVTKKAVSAARADLRLSFLLNSAELTAQAKEEAKVFADALRRPELSGKRFRIEGHTDASGPRALNVSLSQRRAAAVADYLSSLGVARNRFEVRGYGPDRPLDGRKATAPDNRRVEALLL